MNVRTQCTLQLLPIHLLQTQVNLLCLASALGFANDASPNSSGNWKFSSTVESDDGASNDFKRAVLNLAIERDREALIGIQTFLSGPLPMPRPADEPVVWTNGTARLLAYRDETRTGSSMPPVLLIPSLINRYYILDLNGKRSLARYLAAQGHDVYLLDWGRLAEEDHAFSTSDYLLRKLIPAVRFLFERHARPLVPIGFCMGGLLTLALVQLHPEWIDRFGLLATPWNFHAEDSATIRPSARIAERALSWLEKQPYLPGEAIPLMFHFCDPWRFREKFIEFAHIRSAKLRRHFTEIELWSNDCVPLAKGVAEECLFAWLHRNDTFNGNWTVAGEAIRPTKVRKACFFAAPQHDRIVSLGNTLALGNLLQNKHLLLPRAGHIGMIIGTNRRSQLWEPLCAWLVGR